MKNQKIRTFPAKCIGCAVRIKTRLSITRRRNGILFNGNDQLHRTEYTQFSEQQIPSLINQCHEIHSLLRCFGYILHLIELTMFELHEQP